jgi:serine/threonine protein phosphatase PrpC
MDARLHHQSDQKKPGGRSRPQKADVEEKRGEAARLASEYFEKYRANPRDNSLGEIRQSYSCAIRELANMRELEEWEIERDVLPDEIKNLRCRPYGLPTTLIPFSLSYSWKNPLLEQALMDLPDRSNELLTIARILDRYVKVSFPLSAISDFYQPAAAELQLISEDADEPAYVFRLIQLSRELTGKHHNLKMELHKSICIETGDSLVQMNPAPLRITLKKPSFEKKESTPDLARSLMQKVRIPLIDGIVPPKYSIPAKMDLESHLDISLKPGREAVFAHPDLPGMEFSAEQCGLAYSLMIYGDFFTNFSGAGIKAPVEFAPLLNTLCLSEDFAGATLQKDRRAQARFALEVVSKASYVSRLMDENGGLDAMDAWLVADEDFALAGKMVSEYNSVKVSSPDNMTRAAVKRMLQVGNDNPDIAVFDIALLVISEKRTNRESLTTLKPPPPEMMPPPSQPAPGRLAFPFPNDVLDLELEKHLPQGNDPENALVQRVARTLRYYVSLGQTDNVLPVYLPAVTRLLGSYSHEDLVGFARMLVETETRPKPAKTIVMFPEASSTDERQADVTTEDAPVQVSTEDEPRREASEEPTRPNIRPLSLMFEKLRHDSPNSLELVMEILGRDGECTESELEEILKMHPGVRDLRFRNILSRAWTEGDWRGQPEVNEPSDFDHKRSAMDSLLRVCALEAASLEMMREAALDVSNLSGNQLQFVGKLFGIAPQAVTPRMVEGFAVWVSGDEQALKAHWEANFPDVFALINLSQKMVMNSRTYTSDELELLGKVFGKPADRITSDDIKRIDVVSQYLERLRSFANFWSWPTIEQRRKFWRRGNLDTLAATDLIHKVTFAHDWKYENEDHRLLARIYGRNPANREEMDSMTTTFVNAILHKSSSGGPAAELAELHNQIVQNPIRDVLESARAHDEFATLCDFLGVKSGKHKGALAIGNSVCRPKILREKYDLMETRKEQTGVSLVLSRDGGITLETFRYVSHSSSGSEEYIDIESQTRGRSTFQIITKPDGTKSLVREFYNATNDDAISQATITLESGETIELDGVFDGMGGHDSGYVASGIMKQAFEVAALSGWITTPEDARKLIVLADVMLSIKQFKKKQFGSKKMGTTAVIGFQQGEDLYLIHCGDSDGKLYRDGILIFSTVGHALVNQILEMSGVQLGKKTREAADLIKRYATSVHLPAQDTKFRILGTDTLKASTDGRTVQFTIIRDGNIVCQGQGSPILHEKLIEIMESEHGNIVTGAVGNNIGTTTINNKKHDYQSIKTQRKDIKLICSDGITVPLCSHETPLAIEQCNGNLQQAAELLLEWAESRRANGKKMFKPNCHCDERSTKNDDKSVILKRVGDS